MVEGKTTGHDLRRDGPLKGIFPAAFSVNLQLDRDVAFVTVIGDLDLATAPRLQEVLQTLPKDIEMLTLDMDQVTFMDVAGFQALLLFDEAVTKMHIRTASRPVRRLLELARGEELLHNPEPHPDDSYDELTDAEDRAGPKDELA